MQLFLHTLVCVVILLITLFFVLLSGSVFFFSLFRSEINCHPKLVNIFSLDIDMLIKDIGVITSLPNVFALPDMCYFWKSFLLSFFFQKGSLISWHTPAHPQSLPHNLFLYTHLLQPLIHWLTNSSTHWVFFLIYEWYYYWYAAYACSNFIGWSASFS